MRQSLSEYAHPSRHASTAALGIGLLPTVITLVALVIDQTSIYGIADHVDALYSPFSQHPDPNVLFGYLYATGVIGILLWMVMLWGVRAHRRWARAVGSMVLVNATGSALLVLFVSEHGTRIFPTVWGILGILPCVAGLAAVTVLWKPARTVPTAR